MSMSSFLKDFRAALHDKYDFELAEEGKTLCENEEKSNNVHYFNCVRLNDDGETLIEPGQKFIEKHNLHDKRPERQTRAALSSNDLDLDV
jgi:hypothetical protein